MKKLLCGFFAVTLVSSSSLLVSSNSVTNTVINKNILKIKSESLKSINKKESPIDEIIKIFENGIDGSFLTDHDNFNDGLKVFQKVAASISLSISVKLAAGVSPTKYLSVGPNSINLSVSDGQNTVQVNGIIKNVQNYDKNILNKVISFLDQGINGSNYTTKTTYQGLALLLTNLLQDKFNDKNLSLKVAKSTENSKTLNAGTNKIDFIVSSGDVTRNDTVTITNVPKASNYTWLWVSLGILLSIGLGVAIYYIVKAIEKYINSNHFHQILDLLTNGVPATQFSPGSYTQGDALSLFENQAQKIDSNVQIELTNPSQKNDGLVKGTNIIQVNVSLGSNSQTIKAKLTNVGYGSFNNLINKFKNGIPGSALTAGLSKFKDAAFLLQFIAQETFSGATVTLVDSSIKNVSLSAGLVVIKVNVTLNGRSQIIDAKLTDVTKNNDSAKREVLQSLLDGVFNNLSNRELTVQQALDKCNILLSHFNYTSSNVYLKSNFWLDSYKYMNLTVNQYIIQNWPLIHLDFSVVVNYIFFAPTAYVNFHN